MKYIFLIFFIVQCTPSYVSVFKDCKDFSQSYVYRLHQIDNDSPSFSWKNITIFHEDTLEILLKNWPQTVTSLSQFSDFYFAFLRTQIYLECGFFEDYENLPNTSTVIQFGIHRVTYDTDEFQTCANQVWKNTQNILFKSCSRFFSN